MRVDQSAIDRWLQIKRNAMGKNAALKQAIPRHDGKHLSVNGWNYTGVQKAERLVRDMGGKVTSSGVSVDHDDMGTDYFVAEFRTTEEALAYYQAVDWEKGMFLHPKDEAIFKRMKRGHQMASTIRKGLQRAASLPKGSPERRTLLAALSRKTAYETGENDPAGDGWNPGTVPALGWADGTGSTMPPVRDLQGLEEDQEAFKADHFASLRTAGRSAGIRHAYTLPKGHPFRRKVLAAAKQAWGEKLRGGTEKEFREALGNAPRARKNYIEGGRQTMDVEWKDKGTTVAKKTIIYKRDGKTVQSEHYLINPAYLNDGDPNERGW
jgi:hypothetical protein